jgi:hypothetical protein
VLSAEIYPHVEISFQNRKIITRKQYKNPNFIHQLDIDSNCSCAHGSPLLAAAAATRIDRSQPARAERRGKNQRAFLAAEGLDGGRGC